VATFPAIHSPEVRRTRARKPAGSLDRRIVDFTAHRLQANPDKVTQEARLREDLGLTDDEAMEFFEAYSAEFKVDVDWLFSRYWVRHFGPFGIGWGSLILMFLTAGSAGLLAGFAAPREAWLLWASLTLLELVVLRGFPFTAPELNLVPIRVSDLARAARLGFWFEPGRSGRRRHSPLRRRKDKDQASHQPAFGPILVRPASDRPTAGPAASPVPAPLPSSSVSTALRPAPLPPAPSRLVPSRSAPWMELARPLTARPGAHPTTSPSPRRA